jgi:hypothetical protein
MNYQDIISNVLTSSFVVGLATYFIQKQIDKRFNKLEEFQKTLIAVRKERYDTLLKTLQDIWEKIIETEHYIRHDLSKQIQDAHKVKTDYLEFDSKPLLDTYIFIEKRSIFLSQDLSGKTRDFFVNHLQKTYNGFIEVLNEVINGTKDFDDAKNFIPENFGEQYKKDLNELREEFEKQARYILYGE